MDLPEEIAEYPDEDNKQKRVHECLICFRVFMSAYRLRRHR